MDERKPSRSEKIILDNWDLIGRQRKAGMSWDMIAMSLGVGDFTMLRYRNPDRYFRDKERKRLDNERARRELGVAPGRPKTYNKVHVGPREKVEILGELPPQRDNRTLTERIFGDPLPERSYLGRMRAQESNR
jgi:hypothetical protein